MVSVSSWILSIAGIICLSVLLELVLPDGQLNKYVKNIFSFVVIWVVIFPIPNLLKNVNFNQDIFVQEEILLQDNYLSKVENEKNESLIICVQEDLSKNGYDGVLISIKSKKDSKTTMFVDLGSLVITGENVNKNILEIKEDIKIIIKNYFGNVEVKFNE